MSRDDEGLTSSEMEAVDLLIREGGAGILAVCKTSLYDVPFIHWRTAQSLEKKGILTKPERDSSGEFWVRLHENIPRNLRSSS